MDRIVEIDPHDLIARVQPGVVNADLQAAVAAQGLFYPPDPASYATSTIGGNIATNAGGLCCVKYGATRASVLSLEVVLADGTVIRTGGRLSDRRLPADHSAIGPRHVISPRRPSLSVRHRADDPTRAFPDADGAGRAAPTSRGPHRPSPAVDR
jgi:hypothetical protein